LDILRPLRFAGLAVFALAAFCAAGHAQPANERQNVSSQTQKMVDPPAGKGALPAAHPIAVSDTYRIGIGDQLLIAVWHERDLSLSVVVRPDGVITIPLLNDLYVVGQTPKELGASITEKLKPFVNEPQVTVSVSSIQSRKVYLVGQAARQGAFPLNEKKTVLELITEAGGLGQFAKSGSIYVLRVVDGKETRIPFNYKKVVSGKNPDVDLLPGDRVIVP
jgi:polysaccharide export outer membrane protein